MKLHYTLLMATAATVLSATAMADSNGMSAPDTDTRVTAEDREATSAIPGNLPEGQIEEIQTTLKDKGYNVSVDGRWGPQTQAAIREFQSANNLSVTGNLDNQTLAELDLDFDTSGGTTR